ncbi:alpha/beta fold hydrolase [Aurantimonas aggregata]|uniref:Alpha/beta fold hydrolase n=1 Tax=Aurantimonas aggregata TaxID=2047720 RepID=A0A6L9MP99_9HYPH|nr:alpha/beta hydrolase [Aurantimonas aggregata]NDV89268.1 alpha/beta fold hydrolase [Aurantimonas aggregata]
MSDVRTESESGEIVWRWKGDTVTVGLERRGSGRSILLLPAMSSISTRAEMHGLQARLSERFATVAIDWPGFGDRPRERSDWRPEHYRDFIRFVSETVVPRPYATVAAGHGAGYALAQAAAVPGSLGRVCLVAPTWRGPLPTMACKRLPVFGKIARAGDTPVLGSLLYRLNVNRPVVRMMARGHVYADPQWLDAARTTSKMALTRAAGARRASLRRSVLVNGFGSRQAHEGPRGSNPRTTAETGRQVLGASSLKADGPGHQP